MREGAGPGCGPAPFASRHLHRAALLAALDQGAWLTALVAGAGAGKTTLLSSWAANRSAAWLTLGPEHAAMPVLRHDLADAIRPIGGNPAARAVGLLEPHGEDPVGLASDEQTQAAGLASVLAGGLDQPGDPPFALVLDNVHHLPPGGAAARLVEDLCRHAPRGLRLLVSSRTELPFPVDRLRRAGRLTELRDADLAFADFETYQLLTVVLGDAAAADALAAQLHALALGRPGLVVLGAAWLAAQPADQRRARLGALGGGVEPARSGAAGGGSQNGLAEYLASQLFTTADPAAQDLVRRAVYLPRISAVLCRALGLPAAADPAYAVPLVTPVAGMPDWYEVPAGLRQTILARHRLPDEEREALLAAAARWYAGHDRFDDALVVAVAAASPEPVVELLTAHGTRLLVAGRATDVAAAAARVPADRRSVALDLVEGEARHLLGDQAGALACLRRLVGDGAGLPAGVAYRIGVIQRLNGDLDAALANLRQARLDGADPTDAALVHTQLAGVYWARGELAACREAAGRALVLARDGGGDRALAAAHSLLAMAAEQAGDLDGNATHMARAMAAAQRAGDLNQQIRLRVNASGRLLEAGRNATALIELDEAMRLIETTGAMDRYALVRTNRGWAYRAMGRLDEAVAELEAAADAWRNAGSGLLAYALTGLGSVYLVRGDLAQAEAALAEAHALGEATGDHQALAGLSTLARVRYATDRTSAWRLTERSIETGLGLWRSWAMLTAGWLALHDGDLAAAGDYADQAQESAAARGDANALAETLELRGWLAADDAAGAASLRDAQARWTRLGNPIFVARAAAGLAARSGGDLAAAEARLRALGVRPESALAAGPLRAANAFADAAALPFLPTARAGLDRFADGDLGRAQQLLTDAVGSVREAELATDPPAEAARRTNRSPAEAARHGDRARAEPTRHGDDSSPTPDVAPPSQAATGRGEVRATYLDALRALASASAAAGEVDVALRWYLRLLEHDPDDEAGHLGVVIMLARSGRHEEARRRYRGYSDRMRSAGLEPAPYPSEWAVA